MTIIRWEEGSLIRTETGEGEMTISANREGLLSLANILTELAAGVPGDHVHLDEHNSLEAGSPELILERIR